MDKSSLKNAKNGPIWQVFLKPKTGGQAELPDKSVLTGEKLVENAKIEN